MECSLFKNKGYVRFSGGTLESPVSLRHRVSCYFPNCFHCELYVNSLPEIPSATVETNTLMRTAPSNELPPFKSLTLRECLDGSAKMALEFETWIRSHCQKLSEANKLDLDFRSVVEEVEMRLAPVQYAGGTCRLLAGVKHFHPNIIPRLRGLQNLLARSRASRFSDESYFGIIKQLTEKATMNESQKALLSKYIMEFKLNGLQMSDKKKRLWVEEYRRRLFDTSFKFRRNVEMASSQLNLTLDPSIDLDEAPDHLIEMWSQNKSEPRKGAFVLSFSSYSYYPFLRYCRQRPTRGAIWKLFNSRAGFEEKIVQLNNSMQLEELRNARQGLATTFGYDCYASMALQGRMAKSVDDVENMIVSLKDTVVPKFAEQCEGMTDLSASVDFLTPPLRPWDVDYYARKLAEMKYGVSFNAISEYFPYSHVMPALLKLLEDMFDIEFLDAGEKAERWSDMVNVFEVTERGVSLGHLYIDPFISSKKLPACWTRSKVAGYTPIVYLHLNLPSSNIRGDNPALFHWDHLTYFFREIGRSLQLLLTRTPFWELASGETMEHDCVMVVPYVLENLLMQPQCLMAISAHYSTGAKLSFEEALNFRKGEFLTSNVTLPFLDLNLAIQAAQLPMLVRDLFKSDFDLLIHKSNMNFWFDMYREKSKEYFPFGWEKGDYHPCNDLLVADDQAAASSYKQLWSEVVACDLLESMGIVSKGADDDSFRQFCDRFKRHYLTTDGSLTQSEAFRRFTGRSLPSVNGLLKLLRLSNAEMEKSTPDDNMLSDFEILKVLKSDDDMKLIAVQARKRRQDELDANDDGSRDAVVVLEKKPFTEESVAAFTSDSNTRLTTVMHNDIYRVFNGTNIHKASELNGKPLIVHSMYFRLCRPFVAAVKVTTIYPATADHIRKWTEQPFYMVSETPEDYKQITEPYILKNKLSLEWVYAVLSGKAEAERIIRNDEDAENGFVLAPSLRWDGVHKEQMDLTAIVRRRDLKSIRHLRADHLPLLYNLWEKCTMTIKEKYNVEANEMRVYFHYQPTYYHLHVHFTYLKEWNIGTAAGRAHLFMDVVQNLQSDGDYYAKRTMYFTLRQDDPLLTLLDRRNAFIRQ
ncbi:hypothetical protein M514_20123 [Trichuris suis]|uniref:m7GpppX diphosphatase n=1 Tax=Trichuris suis TaxID=68888 RepID=A0A085NDT1_9BILA|nr:hypothetical protein M514_20123 [Trichuris suis]